MFKWLMYERGQSRMKEYQINRLDNIMEIGGDHRKVKIVAIVSIIHDSYFMSMLNIKIESI